MKKLYIFILAMLLSSPAFALSYKVLAVVDGTSISSAQVRDRVNLIVSSSGLENNAANRKKTTAEVTEILINEVLQRKEAERQGFAVTEKDMQVTMADLEKKNGLKPGEFKKFISSKGISYDALYDQVKASVLWSKVLGANIRHRVKVTDSDIEKAKQQIAARPRPIVKKAVNISEIIIPIEFEREAEAKELAETVVRTARSGSYDFGELAKKYSVGKTAEHKGLVGWLPEEGMIEPLASKVKATAIGKITNPIQAQSMYVIIKVNDRKSNEPTADNTKPEDLALNNLMEGEAKKYVKQLRDAAFIERKFTDANLNQSVWE